MSDFNFALGWRNHVFYESDATIDLDVGSVTAGALSALRDMRLSKRVTMSDTAAAFGNASIVLHWHVAESRAAAIQLVGLLNYTLSAPGAESIIVQLSVLGVAGTGDVIEQTLTRWERPSPDFPLHLWHILDEPIADGYWVTVFITATMGAEGGTLAVTAGGLWAGPLFTLPRGLEASWWQKPDDRGRMGLSEGNQGYPRRRKRRRVFGGRAVHIPFEYAYGDEDDESIMDVQQLLFRVGTTEPIVLFPRTRNRVGARSVHVMHRLGMYSHLSDTGRIEEMGGDEYQWTQIEASELM